MRRQHQFWTNLAICGLSGLLGAAGCWYEKFEVGDSSGDTTSGFGGDGGDDGNGDGDGSGGNAGGNAGDGDGTGGGPDGDANAVPDGAIARQGETVVVDLFGNDEGTSLSLIAADDEDALRPSNLDAVEFSVSKNGVLSFRSAAGFWGTYRGSYTIEDSAGSTSTAPIEIHVVPEAISVATIEAGYGGLTIDGAESDALGAAISSAGDVNGDGFADFLLGAPGSESTAPGRVALVLGGADPTSLDLAAPGDNPHVQIFTGTGADETLKAGVSVSRAGRLNADDLDDVVIGAAKPGTQGRAYAIYGSTDFPAAPIALSDAPSDTRGFTVRGDASAARTGVRVAGGGDLNGDGTDDLLVCSEANGGTMGAIFDKKNDTITNASSMTFNSGSGAYVAAIVGDMFGGDKKAEVLTASFDRFFLLRGKDGTPNSWPTDTNFTESITTGWKSTEHPKTGDPRVTAAGAFDGAPGTEVAFCTPGKLCRIVSQTVGTAYRLDVGWEVAGFASDAPEVSGLGDINGDGYDDLLFADSTKAYVLWGLKTLPFASLDIGSLDADGITVDMSGNIPKAVALLGDVNGDGWTDYGISSPTFGGGKGRVYVVFGTRTTLD